MTQYRKKPVVIEAVQLPRGPDHDAVGAVLDFIKGSECQVLGRGCIEIPTLEGTMLATPGDWIIRGTAGELYPCKPDIFEQIYERVAA